jgi:hypothetical protein
MIKFFRSIRKNLLKEGKTTKYLKYAIGEIVLVVIGILIALQINNWNEDRKERIVEKDVLNDILTSLEQNNNVIHESLAMLDDFDRSSDIVLEALSQKKPYSDTLAKHFLSATRTAGLLFPLSSAGYESLKNEGFNIILSDSLKDQIMDLFEVSIKTVQARAQWTMDTGVTAENYFATVFIHEPGERMVPLNYDQLSMDSQIYYWLNNIKDNKRAFLEESIIKFLNKSERLAQNIKRELKQD